MHEYHVRIKNSEAEKVVSFWSQEALSICKSVVAEESSENGVPHYHAYVQTESKASLLRNRLSSTFGKGNKNFSISVKRKNSLVYYVVKDHNIIYYKGYTKEEIDDLLKKADLYLSKKSKLSVKEKTIDYAKSYKVSIGEKSDFDDYDILDFAVKLFHYFCSQGHFMCISSFNRYYTIGMMIIAPDIVEQGYVSSALALYTTQFHKKKLIDETY